MFVPEGEEHVRGEDGGMGAEWCKEWTKPMLTCQESPPTVVERELVWM